MKLRQLEITLQRLQGYTSPRADLEQYPTPAGLAARLLFDAWIRGDIEDRHVCDPGCGTGILGIGAALLGAREVSGIEIDSRALKIAEMNARSVGVELNLIEANIAASASPEQFPHVDTVIMNPPFGAQRLHADRAFIDLSLEIADITYSIFNAGTLPFLTGYIQGRAEIDSTIAGKFPLKRAFVFHKQDVYEIEVEIIRLVKRITP